MKRTYKLTLSVSFPQCLLSFTPILFFLSSLLVYAIYIKDEKHFMHLLLIHMIIIIIIIIV